MQRLISMTLMTFVAKIIGSATDYGHWHDVAPRPPPPKAEGGPGRERLPPRGKEAGATRGGAGTGGGSAPDVCLKYNAGSCTAKPCPNRRRHVCRYCGGKHMGIHCSSKPGGAKQHGKDKGKGKGKEGKGKRPRAADTATPAGGAE